DRVVHLRAPTAVDVDRVAARDELPLRRLDPAGAGAPVAGVDLAGGGGVLGLAGDGLDRAGDVPVIAEVVGGRRSGKSGTSASFMSRSFPVGRPPPVAGAEELGGVMMVGAPDFAAATIAGMCCRYSPGHSVEVQWSCG